MIKVLLVNPPIYDFTAFDFWLRPYGMLRVAGMLRHACDLTFFDFLTTQRQDAWGRGKFECRVIAKPSEFRDIPRKFRRYGRPQEEFQQLLMTKKYDAVLIQSTMTYWYLGLKEVIEDVRRWLPKAKIAIGGPYATLCPDHARSLGADLIVKASWLAPLWELLSIVPFNSLPLWQPPLRRVGVIKLTDGCPFRCTYCSVPLLSPDFSMRPLLDCLQELRQLLHLGARQIAFYDDALLFRPQELFVPFLKAIVAEKLPVAFHTPNALNARLMTADLAQLMVAAGCQSFFLGFESLSHSWQKGTGGKINEEEYAEAVATLRVAGAQHITTYIIIGHPDADLQEVEASMHFASRCGTKILLSEFSPIPGTPDAERSRPWTDMKEPLTHNKTAFALRRLGDREVQRFKALARELNAQPR